MKKRSLSVSCLMLCIALFISLFSGCSDAKDSSASNSPDAAAAAATDSAVSSETSATTESIYPLSKEPVTLTLFTDFPPPMSNALNSDISQMYCYQVASEVTNVKIEATLAADDADEKFALELASGDIQDIVYRIEGRVSSLDAAIDDGTIISLNDYLDNAPNYKKLLDENESFKKAAVLDSGLIPGFYGLADTSTICAGPQIRQDLLEEIGMETPATFDDLEKVLLAFKSELGIKYPILSTSSSLSRLITTGYSCIDTFPIGDDGKTVNYNCLTDKYKSMIEMAKRWYDEGIITSDTISQQDYEKLITAGETAVWFDNIKLMSPSFIAGISSSAKVGALNYVTVDKGETLHQESYNANPVTDLWVISGNCKDPKLAASFIDFFFTDQGGLACNYGIEGKSFNYDEEGNPKYTDLVLNNQDGLPTTVAQAVYSSFWVPYVHMESRTTAAYISDAEFAASDIWKSNTDETLVYHGNMTIDEGTEYSSIMADIETYVEETSAQFITGVKSMDDWDSFIKQIKSMNIEEAIKIKQAAYDRYISK